MAELVCADPPIIRCPRCARWCMDVEKHQSFCNDDDIMASPLDVRASSIPPPVTASSFDWEDRPATARSIRDQEGWGETPPAAIVHIPCEHCGRRFTEERLPVHQRTCASSALPGFRAMVAALDKSDHNNDLVSHAQRRTEAAETRASKAESALLEAERRLANAEAAAQSMEASYDVMAEAVQDGKKREAVLVKRAEVAEAALQAASERAEREAAAARSMEASYDVMAEAVQDGKKREELLSEQIAQLQVQLELQLDGSKRGPAS
jgi:hypothetical protein